MSIECSCFYVENKTIKMEIKCCLSFIAFVFCSSWSCFLTKYEKSTQRPKKATKTVLCINGNTKDRQKGFCFIVLSCKKIIIFYGLSVHQVSRRIIFDRNLSKLYCLIESQTIVCKKEVQFGYLISLSIAIVYFLSLLTNTHRRTHTFIYIVTILQFFVSLSGSLVLVFTFFSLFLTPI